MDALSAVFTKLKDCVLPLQNPRLQSLKRDTKIHAFPIPNIHRNAFLYYKDKRSKRIPLSIGIVLRSVMFLIIPNFIRTGSIFKRFCQQAQQANGSENISNQLKRPLCTQCIGASLKYFKKLTLQS